MDDHLKAIEEELRALRPAALPPDLVRRIARELDPAPVERPAAVPVRRWRWWMMALPAAAALAVGAIGLRIALAPQAAGSSGAAAGIARAAAAEAGAFKPVSARNVLYGADDEGLVILDDGTPARRERLHFVDTITWRNPRTNASLTWSLPREEVRLVPVLFQ